MSPSQPLAGASSSEFVRLTRNALTHLYDSVYLENHPLTAMLDAGGSLVRVTRAQRLRRTLLDCLDALRPQAATGTGAEASRAHAILTYRYVDGMPMEEIAARRALSERQAYRELERGLEALAALLQERLGDPGRPGAPGPLARDAVVPDPVRAAQAEVARLRPTAGTESLAPEEVFRQVLAMLAPVLAPLAVQVQVVAPTGWPRILADRVMFRQAILNLLTGVGHAIAPGRLTVTAQLGEGGMLHITLAPDRPSSDKPGLVVGASPDDPVRLGVARALVEGQGGRFEMILEEDRWCVSVWFPTAVGRTILVVDDNQDLIALFQRYLAGHDFTVVGVPESRQVLRVATELQPALILLDVMMPSLDGWELLQQLKATPAIAKVPIIVCSVLHEPELARGMGASDYLTKPVQQTDLLAVLAHHLA